MRSLSSWPRRGLLLLLLLGLAALDGCSRRDSSIPAVDGPLTVTLRYPVADAKVGGDSIAAWGTVGTGRSTLHVNGVPVTVENNGAFAAFLPLPPGAKPVLTFVAVKGRDSVRRRIPLRRDGDANGTAPDTVRRTWSKWVSMRRLPSDTADSATQWRPIYSRWRPRGAVALALTQGLRFRSDLRTTSAMRLVVSPTLRVWIPIVDGDTTASPAPLPVTARALRLSHTRDVVQLTVPMAREVPTTVELAGDRLHWTLHGATWSALPRAIDGLVAPVRRVVARAGSARRAGAPARAETAPTNEPDAASAHVDIGLTHMPLGWRSEWKDGAMQLTIRIPPAQRPNLEGLTILLDPGHPPDGTVGPSGLVEDSITLAVARVAAGWLRALGARVTLTRADSGRLSVEARAAMITQRSPHLFVSIHANAPGPGRPPVAVHGTQVYYMQPNGRQLARAFLHSVSDAMRHPALGAYQGEYAVLRQTWATAALVEGTPLIIPEREAFLRTPAGIAAYAQGIVDGVLEWRRMPEAFALPLAHTP